MKKLSECTLIDMASLSRILKDSNAVIWGIDGEYAYISDLCMAVKVRIPGYEPPKALRLRFLGMNIPQGGALRSIKRKKGYDVDIISLDGMKRVLGTEAEIPIDDTCIMYQTVSGGTVRAMYVEDPPHASYIFLNMMYLECINRNSTVRAAKPERTSPVVFSRGDEVAIVLPVNIDTPAFMARVN